MTPQLFEFEEHRVRTVVIGNEPYFVGKDVAAALGYSETAKAVRTHVPEKFRGVSVLDTPGGKQEMTVISEAGLYKLAFKSHAENAEKFTDWVASDVLPTIRKHGAYMTDAKAFNVIHNADGLADLLRQAADQLKAKDVQIADMKPKALFADAVATSNSTILIGQLAKIMRQNGVDIGQNRLFAWMRSNGYLGTRGSNYNVPTQYAVERGLFKTKETVITHSDGHTTVNITTKVTGKGQQYFINKFLKK